MNRLHVDGLGSVRAVTAETGLAAERATYRPFGDETAQTLLLTTPKESAPAGTTGPSLPTHGFIGERFDDTSGLQYLNARYYAPKLGMFIQPDRREVTKEGVGTNRYSYSFGDPVNGRDTTGHSTKSDSADMSQDVHLYDDDEGAGSDLPEHLTRISADERNEMYPDAVWEDE